MHYVAPTDDNSAHQCERMKSWGIYTTLSNEIGAISIAQVDKTAVPALTKPDATINLIRGEEVTGARAEPNVPHRSRRGQGDEASSCRRHVGRAGGDMRR